MKKTAMRTELRLTLILVALVLAVYQRVSVAHLDLVTGLTFLAAFSALLFLAAEISMGALKAAGQMKTNIRILLTTIILVVAAVELFFRFGLDSHATYGEQNGDRNYHSLYPGPGPSWFHAYRPMTKLRWSRAGFTHVRTINHLGLTDDIPLEASEREFRIIALGDSFTEGLGTASDSTWVKVVERLVASNMPSTKVTTLNAGIVGSDVWFEYVLLKERLLPYHPDLVIVAINNTDVHDIMMKGGRERFHSDGSYVPSRAAPKWEWVYGISFIFRHIIHDVFQYDPWLMKAEAVPSAKRQAQADIRSAVDAFVELSRLHRFDVLFVLHPESMSELRTGQYEGGFAAVAAELALDRSLPVLDVLEYYAVHGIDIPEDATEWFWPIDAHHTAKGYEVLGTAIANAIVEGRQ